MAVLEYDAFLSELTRLFYKTRTSGAVSLTMKRYDGRTKPEPRVAKKGGTGKSGLQPVTTVHAKDVNKFHMAYANVLKGNMDSLKKHSNKKGGGGGGRVKETTKKTKATQ